MTKPTEDQSLKRITNQVNNTLEVSDVLSGKKPVGGKLGQKIKQKQIDEKDISKGKDARRQKFKEFDDWCDRTETVIRNNSNNETGIQIKRAIVLDKNNPNKIVN